MASIADLLAYFCAGAVVVASIAAPIASAKGKASVASGWFAALVASGLLLSGLQYDGRGTFLMWIALALVTAVVGLMSIFAALIGRSRRERASSSLN